MREKKCKRVQLGSLEKGDRFYIWLNANRKSIVEVQSQECEEFTRTWINGTIAHFNKKLFVEKF